MTGPESGNKEYVNLREVWQDEASDFTPWLAQNLDRLGKALNMELELCGTEALAGDFRLDILAKDGNGKAVVIENELEPTWDHGHLGQLLTYAAHFSARTLIWVAPWFNDVQRAAIEWLNRWTGENIKIYGVEVRVLRIGDSPPAPEFHIAVGPGS